MAQKRGSQLDAVIKEVEAIAKVLRADIRKRIAATHLPRTLARTAERLRKRAAYAAMQVEKYAHELRLELEKAGPAKARKARPKKAAGAAKRKSPRRRATKA
jgi:hypothetical protein